MKPENDTVIGGSKRGKVSSVRFIRGLFTLSMLGILLIPACAPWVALTPPPIETLMPKPKQDRTIVSNTLPLHLKWKYKLDQLLGSPLSVEDKQLIVWQGNLLSAVDAETGREEWRVHGDYDFDFVTAVGQRSIVYDRPEPLHGQISILDAATGQLKWKKQMSVVYAFAIGDGRLYVGWSDHASAYDLSEGNLRWDMTEGLPTHRGIMMYYDAGKVYVTTYNHLFVLNATDGQVLRSFDYPTTRLEVVAEETVFGVAWPNVLATDAQMGVTRWTKHVSPLDGYLRPTLLRGILYVLTQDGELVALDAGTGEQKWIAESVQKAFSNVVEFNGIGYVLSKDGRLYGFDIGTGRQIGVLATSPDFATRFGGAPAIPSLAVVGSTLAVTWGDSFVYGFEQGTP